VCVVCGRSFTARRSDARICSNRCRQRRHRQRQEE
jgi:predicted nucleic acid-binding Zn ribbon protein